MRRLLQPISPSAQGPVGKSSAGAFRFPDRAKLPCVNFFGHSVVARWRSEAPPFVLGAMLPDFAGMIRARPPAADHAELASGISFHHATDHAFHGSTIFRSLTAQAFSTLAAQGVRRGSARAVAHIGVELLLDAALAGDAGARQAYGAALASARQPELSTRIGWRDDLERERFAELCAVLESRAVTSRHAEPELVALRLSRALADRPRLALDHDAERVVRRWASAASDIVARSAPALIDELRRALSV
jgi:hypothetical protein